MEIPNKLYFRIGEVADLVGVKPYVLRYWETEFTDIRPVKSKSGQRLYKRRDVEMLLNIKDLLYNERFTINGARKRLKELSKEQRLDPSNGHPEPQMGLNLVASTGSMPVVRPTKEASKPVPTATVPFAPAKEQIKLLNKLKKELQFLLETIRS